MSRAGAAGRTAGRVAVAALLAVALLPVVLLTSSQTALAGPPPVFTMYVPFEDQQVQDGLRSIFGSGGTWVSTVTTIDVTSAADDSVIYWDHWEDGYEADIANPVQSTTQVWGDNDNSNGITPGAATDDVDAGTVIFLQNNVPLPRVVSDPPLPAEVFFDGRDKVAATRGFAMTRAGWESNYGTVHAGAVAATDLSKWGTQFDFPVGENTIYEAFDYTGLGIMASDDNTSVEIDTDGDGAIDQTTTLDEGETVYIDGGINAGGSAQTSKPAQAHLITGERGSRYEGRWFELYPEEIRGDEYVAAAGSTNTSQRVTIFLQNPGDATINVSADAEGTANDQNISIAPGAVESYDLPAGSGGRFSSPGNPFIAVSGTVAVTGVTQNYDWGYSLVPTASLTPGVVVGWGAGNPQADANHSPVWVAPLDNVATTGIEIYVDFDGDGSSDLVNGDGDGVYDDPFFTADALESIAIEDSDLDMTGARIYTIDGTLISAAWGQDPDDGECCRAYDLGTAVLPSTSLVTTKSALLVTDLNLDGVVNPGDTLEYTIHSVDAGALSLTNLTFIDTLPSTLTYVPNSTTLDGVPVPDDTVGSTVFPVDEAGVDLPVLAPGASANVVFRATLVNPFPLFTQNVRNDVSVTADQANSTATSIVPVQIPDLYIAKHAPTAPLLPGQQFDYTLDVSNVSVSPQNGIAVTDPLPAEVEWVSTSVTRPIDDPAPGASDTVSETWTTPAYDNDSADWLTDWVETDANGGGSGGGDVAIVSELGSNRIRLQGPNNEIRRTFDATTWDKASVTFDWRRQSFEAGDGLAFEISTTGGTTWIQLDEFDGPATDVGYFTTTYDLTRYVGQPIVLRFRANGTMDASDLIFIDDIELDLAQRILETLPGNAPPNLYSNGELLTGESFTVTVTVTVDDPIDPTIDDFTNTASATSAQNLSPVTSSATVEVARASIGDTVWDDVNGNGLVDSGEPRLSGVTVQLLDSGSTVIDTAVTDANGEYLFGDLDPGDYTVTVVSGVPVGMAPNWDDDGGLDETTDVSVTFGENNTTTDFGYATPVTIGDRVFADIDGDGAENGVDFGIDALDVTIIGTTPNSSHQSGSTISTSGGDYSFTNLLPGTYTVTVDTGPLSTAAYGTTTANAQTGNTQTITVTSGNDDLTGDFGYVLPAAIGDLVWHDLDADGIRDAGEPPLSGVEVTLTGTGLPVGGIVRTTDVNGYYLFANLDAGTFTATVTGATGDLPSGWDSSTGGYAQTVTIGMDDVVDTVDFGFYTQASIGDLVFEDVNGNGSFDSGVDAPLDAIDVSITGTSSGASHTGGLTQATVNGAYDFTGLEPGTYTVVVDASGFPLGTVNTLNGASPSVTVQSTDDVDTADFGYLFPATISDFVWHDLDADGMFDSGTESGIGGVELTLTGGSLPVGGITQTTDVDGLYAFSNLPPGTYTVTATTLPSGYSLSTSNGLVFTVDSADVVDTADFGVFTTADIGDLVWHDLDADGLYDLGEPVFDNVTVTLSGGSLATPLTVDTGAGALAAGEYLFADLDPGTYTVTIDTADLPSGYSTTTGGDSRSVVLESAADQLDIDFGYATTATVGDLVYDDLNGDGDRDPGEPGIGGVTVSLDDGSTIVTVDTLADGSYDFTGVAPGTYELFIDTGDLATGSFVTQGDGGYSSVVVRSADDIDTIDFGAYVAVSIGDRLWIDTDGDGVQDTGETAGFAGVTVTLTGGGLPVGGITDVTDAAGDYGFSALEPGAYTVTITTTDLPVGAVNTFGGTSQSTTLTSGDDDLSLDFGWYVPASIGDLVWHDLDGDGVRDAGEPGIDAVTMTLDDGSTTTTIDTVAGAYDFTGLAPGTYSVSLDTADLDAGPISTTGGFSQGSITIGSGDDRNDVDFGVRHPASIGDIVYVDTNGDGDQDVGESGIGGITVTITGTTAGASHTSGTTTVTATSGLVGSYDFGTLDPGTYEVVVDTGDSDLPAGAVASTVTTYTITVVSQDDIDTADFGFYQPASIGDRVFDDVNGDGDDESGGDSGLAGVTLELRQGGSTLTSFTTTASGAYDFTGLAPGTYDVVVTGVPTGYTNTLGGTTQTFTVGSGDDENDADFGYFLGASIGDLVFEDLDGDGAFDAGEPGYDGVTVTLTGGSLPVAGVTQDTVNGAYDFIGLDPGTYTVAVDTGDLPTGVVNTLGGTSQTLTVVSGDDIDSVDFGYTEPASIGDLVWNDLDGDGVRDVGEPGLDGVTVSISGGPTDDTASGGTYSLTGLAPGTYTVTVDTGDLPTGSTSTTGGFSQTVTVVSGDAIDTVDFGVAIPASLGDLVWLDADGDGVRDAGESAISGATVRITGPGIVPAGITDTTDGSGDYGFTGLLPGTYTVTVESGTPAGSFSTTGGSTQTITLQSGQDDDTVDFGYAVPASIGDRVWNDLNGDAAQNDGATGISGVEVTIQGTTSGASHPTGTTTTTGTDGAYLFSNLNPGSYTVSIDAGDLPAGETWSSTTGGRSQTVIIASGDAIETVDFGEVASGSIGDFVFADSNGDGAQTGDSGISGVTVTLTGPGLPVGGITDTTDGSGAYGFTGLAPGAYTVTLTSGIPTGAQSTTGGNVQTVVITSGLDVDTADFGLVQPSTVGDETFIDSNGDGDRDGGEPGLAGVTIELRDGATVVALLTSTTGGYDFTGVLPGTYDVVVTGGLPAGAVNTLGGTSQSVTVTSGDDIDSIDFGWYVPASIGDLVFEDLDGDGAFDAGEPGYDGVTVTLTGGSLPVAGVTQDTVNGAYDFTGLAPGTYTVTVDTADLPAGVVNTLGGVSQTFTVTSGNDVNTVDFGYTEPASIGDLVWNDLDGDGVRDAGEPGLDGVTVSISGGPTDDTVSGGAYSLTGLAPGTYTVTVDTTDLPTGSTATTGGFSQTVTVVSGQALDTVDFGVAIPASLGDTIFQDSDGDGSQDAGELGISGVDVTITGTSSGASHPTGTTVQTGADGAYSFTGLLPGSYSVVVDGADLPAGAFLSTAGGDTQTTVLTSGEDDLTLDFGYVVPSTIGDRVFIDDDADGVFGAGDTGIADVTVTLTGTTSGASHPTGTSLSTSAAGVYDFTNLAPGTYTVVMDTADADFVAAVGATPTSTTGGASLTFTVGSATDENDADFGWFAPASIGDRVWNDLDGDGNQDDGATGISGLDVTITGTSSGASHPTGSTIQTGADGAYDFTGLTPGTYTIAVAVPVGDVVTTVGGATRTVTVGSGDDLDTVDFGIVTPAAVGDLIFHDVDGDGVFGTGDSVRTSVDVTITGPGLPVAGVTDTTDGTGIYGFSGLLPGTYTVTVDTTDLPAGTSSTTGGFSQTFTVTSGQTDLTIDFGDALPASIGDRLFDDLDGDGVDDGVTSEAGFDGVDVTITGPGLPVAGTTVQTDADGVYGFAGLAPGTYTVTVDTADLPAGVVNTLGGTSQNVTVGSGDVHLDVDFGWYRPASIGDLVWIDDNGNGTQNLGESGVVGAELTVTGPSFPAGTTITTTAGGAYDATGLAPGTYTIELTGGVPAGTSSTAGGNTMTVTVESGDDIDTADFGLADFVTIGDRVWHDLDADGAQDGAETDGLGGVDLELVNVGNVVVATETTDASGAYSFTNVRPGQYTVRVVPATVPSGFVATTPESISVTATSGNDVLTADVGYRTTGTIGDLVWDDLDGDGVRDVGEPGLAGVSVALGGAATASTVTDGNGAYSFPGLAPGDYTVTITPPAGSTPTTVGGVTQTTALLSGESIDTLDFGLAFGASLGDLIWHDLDADGTFDAGEPGLSGLLVQLRDGGGVIVATDTTDGNGAYSFTGLAPGDHQITIDPTTLPVGAVSATRFAATTTDSYSVTLTSGQTIDTLDVGYATTAAVEGTVFEDDDASGALDLTEDGLVAVTVELVDAGNTVVDTAITAADGAYTFTGVAPGDYTVRLDRSTVPAGFGPTTPATIAVSPVSDERITDVDFGEVRPSTIGDVIWHDLDDDGTFDLGESGLGGITVELVDSGNTVVDTEITAGDGSYDFSGVVPGEYTVRVDLTTLPSGVNSGAVFVASAGLPTSLPFTIESGDDIDTADFAFRTTAVIGDFVWHDLDADGTFDAGEPALPGVDVQLVDGGNTVIATETTDGAGAYSFTGVAPGTYSVRLDRSTLPLGYSSTTGNDPTTVTVVSDERRDDVDFGEAQLTGGLIGDQIWDDLDGDGTQDLGEPGLDGIDVELVQGGTVVAVRTTTGGGGYTFANLAPGTYTVRVVSSTVPTDYVSSTGGLTQTTTIVSGGVDRDLDFGFVAPATIGDLVWHDLDADGLRDAGELGIGGVTVEIRSGGSVVDTAITNSTGAYSVDVAPGTYDVVLDPTTIPDDTNSGVAMTSTFAPAGSITVVSNETVDTADFGLATTARIGDTIFDDLNGDGDQDPGEPGLVGVDVQLDDGLGGVTTVTTGTDGFYEFTGVTPGSYTVAVVTATLPSGSVATTTSAPVPVTVESDELIDDVDLGYAIPASLAGIVWTDIDGGGTQNGEAPLQGVEVELLDATDTVVDTQTTTSTGAFIFTGLLPGEYSVRPVLTGAMALTVPDAGSDDTIDSDVVPATGRTAAIQVQSGDALTDVDAGVIEPGSIGDTVFADLDEDGVQDADEPGISGVTITVRYAGGSIVGTATTGTDGSYNVPVDPGAHTVTMTVPAGWGATPGADIISTTVGSGQNVDDADFPLLGARVLEGSVIYDIAGDSSLDATDPGLGGITVTATWDGPDGPVDVTTTTGPDGSYAFAGLPPGTYSIVVDPTDLPDGIVDPTVDPDGPTGGIDLNTTVDLSSGSVDSIDFGVTGTARIGDNVFVDANGDGDLDPGEPGVDGITVTAIVSTTTGLMTYTTVTDENGFYEFTDLPAGDYTVSIDPTTIPVGLAPSSGDLTTTLVIGGADDTLDLPVIPIAGPTAVPDTAATPPETAVVIDVGDNDVLQPGTTVTVVSHTVPSDGDVVLLPDGTFSYTPDAGFDGTDTFDYTICDEDNLARFGDTPQLRAVLCSTTTVSIITPPPPPVSGESVDPMPDPPSSPATPVVDPPTNGDGGTPSSTGGAGTPGLPSTGSDAFPIPLLGGTLLGIGLALWALTRRRREPEAEPIVVRSGVSWAAPVATDRRH